MSRFFLTALTILWLFCGQPLLAEPFAPAEREEPEEWDKVGWLAALSDPSRDGRIAARADEDAARMLPYLADDARFLIPGLADLRGIADSETRLTAIRALARLQETTGTTRPPQPGWVSRHASRYPSRRRTWSVSLGCSSAGGHLPNPSAADAARRRGGDGRGSGPCPFE
jgi:hypothetical protein